MSQEQRRLRGIDCSSFQGVISHAVAEGLVELGCAFAFIRCAVGTSTRPDDRFLANVQVFDDVGIPVTPYFFLYPLPHLDPVQQAHLHWSHAGGVGARVGDLAPMSDLEWPPPETRLKDGSIERTWIKMGCSDKQLREWYKLYGAELDDLSGRETILYTYDYWDTRAGLGLDPVISKRPYVRANYAWKGQVPTDAMLATLIPRPGWAHMLALQHDGDGGLRLPVSNVDVDWNVMPDPDDLAEQRKHENEPDPVEHDQELADLASAAHQVAGGIIVDDEIAAYRAERIGVDAS